MMKMAVCYEENVYAVAMVIACRYSGAYDIFVCAKYKSDMS